MVKIIKEKVKEYLIKRLSINTVDRFVPNINLDTTKKQKRVLLIYLDLISSSQQISMNDKDKKSGTCHTNRYELFQIIRALIQLDCCIDVCSFAEPEAKQYIDTKQYDVVLGLGEMFRYAAEHSNAYKILYMTENPYYISYQREKERVDYYNSRHGMQETLFRTGMFFKENDERLADAIICMGEPAYYQQLNVPVKRIFPSAFLNEAFGDYSKREKANFLVLGTDGFIHKGNDLLVEVFNKHSEWNLYMCGYQVTETIKKLGLTLSENIHDCGYIDIGSENFKQLAELCTYIVLPSCSEAPSTAVLTGMRHGMIPIVCHGNGLDDLDKYCIFFDGYMLSDIEKKLEQVMELSDEEIIKRREEIVTYANQEFSLEKFSQRIYENMRQLLENI